MASSAVPPIGARLRAERRRRGISVRGLAREIGVSASLISQIETDKSSPSVSTLYAITTALDISLEQLFGDARSATENGVGPDAGGAPGAPRVRHGDDVRHDVGRADREGGQGGPEAASAELTHPAEQAPAAGTAAAAVVRSGTRTAVNGTLGGRNRRVGPVVRPGEREMLCLDSGVTWELLGQIPGAHVDFLLITYQPGGSSSSSGLLMRHSGIEYGYVISGELTLTLGFDKHRLVAGDAVSFDSTTPHGYSNEGDVPAVGVWFVLERSA